MFKFDVEKFRLRFIQTREERGLIKTKLSTISGVNHATIVNLENHGLVPNIKNLILLADALDCSVDYLCGLEDKDGKPSVAFLIKEEAEV